MLKHDTSNLIPREERNRLAEERAKEFGISLKSAKRYYQRIGTITGTQTREIGKKSERFHKEIAQKEEFKNVVEKVKRSTPKRRNETKEERAAREKHERKHDKYEKATIRDRENYQEVLNFLSRIKEDEDKRKVPKLERTVIYLRHRQLKTKQRAFRVEGDEFVEIKQGKEKEAYEQALETCKEIWQGDRKEETLQPYEEAGLEPILGMVSALKQEEGFYAENGQKRIKDENAKTYRHLRKHYEIIVFIFISGT